jgi:hypothetical protein
MYNQSCYMISSSLMVAGRQDSIPKSAHGIIDTLLI